MINTVCVFVEMPVGSIVWIEQKFLTDLPFAYTLRNNES